MSELTYMDCWNFVAPLIPVTDDLTINENLCDDVQRLEKGGGTRKGRTAQMKKLVCDICGSELTPSDDYSSFKLKEEDKNPFRAGWIRLDVHVNCWQELCKEISKRRRHE